MTAIAWAIIFYTVITNHPTVEMGNIAFVAVAVCTVVEWFRK